jgi:hypothetical protein
MLETLRNPQMIVNLDVTGPLAGAVKTALAVSLHNVFLCATVLVGLGVIFTVMLVDIPLRTTNRRAAEL